MDSFVKIKNICGNSFAKNKNFSKNFFENPLTNQKSCVIMYSQSIKEEKTMVTNHQKQYAYLMCEVIPTIQTPEIIIKEEEKMNKEITLDYIEVNEEERLTNSYDENASIVWIDASEEYAVIYWLETWEGIEVLDVEYSGVDDVEIIINRLYNKGYMY